MPFIDLNKQAFNFESTKYNIVIIGAGAAGILLATELSRKGKKVLVIESGHFHEDEKRQVLNEVTQSGIFVHTYRGGRKRAVGGTTIAWGGQSLPFSKLDFSKRDWINESGWPIEYEQLQGYYDRANTFMGVDNLNYSSDIFKLFKLKRIDSNNGKLDHHFSKWAPVPNFKILYNDYLENNVDVVYNAIVTKLGINNDGIINNIIITDFNKNEYNWNGDANVILAMGTIETNRLLLNSRDTSGVSIGNHSDWLGKCFMEHPCLDGGIIHTTDQKRIQHIFNTHIHKRRKYSTRLSFSPAYQKEAQLTNGSASIMFLYDDWKKDPFLKLKRFISDKKPGFLLFLLKNSGVYLRFGHAILTKKVLYKHNAVIRIKLMMEQEPQRSSYIALSDEADAFGVQKAHINWEVSDKTWQSILLLVDTIEENLNQLNLGTVERPAELTADNKNWRSLIKDVCHHMGGTRMSAVPENGVVDTNLKVWNTQNLYVCSCSVFPTGSHSNPTLTMLALAVRLTEHLC